MRLDEQETYQTTQVNATISTVDHVHRSRGQIVDFSYHFFSVPYFIHLDCFFCSYCTVMIGHAYILLHFLYQVFNYGAAKR